MDATDSQQRLGRGHRHALPDARRASPAEVLRDVQATSESPVATALLEASEATLLVLNPRRQVVAMNARGGGPADAACFAGKRPGELLSCVLARGPGGCGTTLGCETCGALGAIVESARTGRPVEAECLLAAGPECGATTSLELSVRAAPIRLEGGAPFTALSLRDISAEKRREALEHVFFHDVLNTVAGLRVWAELLDRPAAQGRARERVQRLAQKLDREIRDHRDLVRAEGGTLTPAWEAVAVDAIVDEAVATLAGHALAGERTLAAEVRAPGALVETDPTLAVRVLVNMVKNALEASAPGGTVRVTGEGLPQGGARFAVHNAGAIPPEAQARIFQRSFTTKPGRGRGLGTYGMRLLGERWLGGRVGFRSDPAEGTTFTLTLPPRAPRPEDP